MYTNRTRKMNDQIIAAGVPLAMNPILRIRYSTWDSLKVASSSIHLPDFLASAFGRSTIPAAEFGELWRRVVVEQRELLDTISSLKKPGELLNYLAKNASSQDWQSKLSEHSAGLSSLQNYYSSLGPQRAVLAEMYTRFSQLTSEAIEAQRVMGTHFHSKTEWTEDDLSQRELYQTKLVSLFERRRSLLREITSYRTELRGKERTAAIQQLRDRIRMIELESEQVRVEKVRNALLTIEGLPHTDHRPSGWWIPMIDSTGELFKEIATTAHLYLEPLQTALPS